MGLGAGRSGRIVDGLLIVVVARDGGAPMSSTLAACRRRSDCKMLIKHI
eukprot:COSAG05_NODE_17011_length_333_cov_1.320513_1_plen_48_part_10